MEKIGDEIRNKLVKNGTQCSHNCRRIFQASSSAAHGWSMVVGCQKRKKMVGEHILSNWSLMELVAGFLNLFIRVNRLGFEFSLSGLSLWWMVKGFGRGRGVAHGVRNQVTIKCLLCWKISSFCTRQESEWPKQICSSRNDPPLSNSLLYSEEANTWEKPWKTQANGYEGQACLKSHPELHRHVKHE